MILLSAAASTAFMRKALNLGLRSILLAFVTCSATLISSDVIAAVVDVAVGWVQTCLLEDTGKVWCWGSAKLNGQESDTTVPASVQGLSDIRNISAGRIATCAIDSAGAVACWGADFRQDVLTSKPFSIEGLPPVTDISIGYAHICALTVDHDVYCWGDNAGGELGDGTTTFGAAPAKVQGIGKVVSLGTGVNNTCAVEAEGSVKCWGTDDPTSRPEDGNVIHSRIPQKIQELRDMKSVANGRNYACGLRSDGTLPCWGTSTSVPKTNIGGLVPGSHLGSITIVEGKNRIVAADVGLFLGCAIYDDGAMTCWHFARNEGVPTIVLGLGSVEQVSLGADNGCALLRDGTVHCWEAQEEPLPLDHKSISLPSD